MRAPDVAIAQLESGPVTLAHEGRRWNGGGVSVEIEPGAGGMPVRIEAAEAALLRVQLRWHAAVPERWRILNDQWERSYGDLEWRGLAPERVLPWYFLAFDGRATHGYGVATGAACFAFWQVDAAGISLWLDVRNGGGSVRLGPRVLEAATLHARRGPAGEGAFASARRFCKSLCMAVKIRPSERHRKIAANSSGEYGLRKIVSVSRVGKFENGLIAPTGSRCLNVVRNSFSVSFHVLAVTPRLDSASKNDCATKRVTFAISVACTFSLRTNSANRLSVD